MRGANVRMAEPTRFGLKLPRSQVYLWATERLSLETSWPMRGLWPGLGFGSQGR
jgi:hypothetical protein